MAKATRTVFLLEMEGSFQQASGGRDAPVPVDVRTSEVHTGKSIRPFSFLARLRRSSDRIRRPRVAAIVVTRCTFQSPGESGRPPSTRPHRSRSSPQTPNGRNPTPFGRMGECLSTFQGSARCSPVEQQMSRSAFLGQIRCAIVQVHDSSASPIGGGASLGQRRCWTGNDRKNQRNRDWSWPGARNVIQ